MFNRNFLGKVQTRTCNRTGRLIETTEYSLWAVKSSTAALIFVISSPLLVIPSVFVEIFRLLLAIPAVFVEIC